MSLSSNSSVENKIIFSLTDYHTNLIVSYRNAMSGILYFRNTKSGKKRENCRWIKHPKKDLDSVGEGIDTL